MFYTAQERLEARVTHLREIAAWSEALLERLPTANPAEVPAWQRLKETLALAHKLLKDQDHPEAGDALVSLQDSDARFGRHHGSYCGYLLDVAMDAEAN